MVVAIAMALPRVADVLIVRVLLRYRELGFFKKMMNPMGRGGREKKNKEGDDP
jgi:hypothetical protein